ncbi:MAG: hypothetical protein AAGE59_15195 [Cyanobacteria bacterium P01_F01_bin.86]
MERTIKQGACADHDQDMAAERKPQTRRRSLRQLLSMTHSR